MYIIHQPDVSPIKPPEPQKGFSPRQRLQDPLYRGYKLEAGGLKEQSYATVRLGEALGPTFVGDRCLDLAKQWVDLVEGPTEEEKALIAQVKARQARVAKELDDDRDAGSFGRHWGTPPGKRR